jgi:hypothetical protein
LFFFCLSCKCYFLSYIFWRWWWRREKLCLRNPDCLFAVLSGRRFILMGLHPCYYSYWGKERLKEHSSHWMGLAFCLSIILPLIRV